jgi:uncharacterized protein YjbI with pentapeptide repeats
MATFRESDLRGARFQETDMSSVEMRGVELGRTAKRVSA